MMMMMMIMMMIMMIIIIIIIIIILIIILIPGAKGYYGLGPDKRLLAICPHVHRHFRSYM